MNNPTPSSCLRSRRDMFRSGARAVGFTLLTATIVHAAGGYPDEPAGMGNPNPSGQKFPRGSQVSDPRGVVRFTTIYPGWYTSRTAHIHARIRTYSGTTTTLNMTTQFFFDDTISDYVY